MNAVERMELQSELMSLPLLQQKVLVARNEWLETGRSDQMPPSEFWDADEASEDRIPGDYRDDWFFWLMLGGRGAGKTRAGAEDAWWHGYLYPGVRYAIVGPTSNDCRKTCFEGESGLLAKMPPELIKNWNRGEITLTLVNGTLYQGYSAEEPDRLRGPQHHRAWCDELAAWRYLDDTLDNLLMGLRLGPAPRIVATTTPRPIKRIKEIVADPLTVVDTVSTRANMANLPKIFIDKIIKRYENTRKGRQEIDAQILDDNPGALWQRGNLDDRRARRGLDAHTVVRPDGRVVAVTRIVVAVDQAASNTSESDEHGIVVAGLGDDGRGYVLDDLSLSGTPDQWGRTAVGAYDIETGDAVIYEANQGGDMARHVIVSSAQAMRLDGSRKSDFVNVRAVWASKGKVTRAEPVSALYEQGRVSHVGMHAKLEDQMVEFTTDFDRDKMGYSPDRVDALVWALTDLMLDHAETTGLQDMMRQDHERVMAERAGTMPGGFQVRSQSSIGSLLGEKMHPLVPPDGVNTVTGITGHEYRLESDGMFWVSEEDLQALVRLPGWRRG